MKYQREYSGKITQREAIAIAERILSEDGGIPQSCYTKTKYGLDVIVGSRKHSIKISSGMTYFDMQSLVGHCETVAREYKTAKSRKNQIDLEDAIAGAP